MVRDRPVPCPVPAENTARGPTDAAKKVRQAFAGSSLQGVGGRLFLCGALALLINKVNKSNAPSQLSRCIFWSRNVLVVRWGWEEVSNGAMGRPSSKRSTDQQLARESAGPYGGIEGQLAF